MSQVPHTVNYFIALITAINVVGAAFSIAHVVARYKEDASELHSRPSKFTHIFAHSFGLELDNASIPKWAGGYLLVCLVQALYLERRTVVKALATVGAIAAALASAIAMIHG